MKLREILGLALLLGYPGVAGFGWAAGPSFSPASIPLTLLHTNDFHSRYRPDKGPLGLGGIARLSTAIQQQRKLAPQSLLLDGGDWSEGSIYYNLDAGRETLRMMDLLGYDAAVVGNHDWINGPDVLLDSITAAESQVELVAQNLDVSDYPRATDFRTWVHPQVVKTVHGVKVGIIGVSTNEKIYAPFLQPIQLIEPYKSTQAIAGELKRQGIDVVVVISNNRIDINKRILQRAPAVDLIIGAHDPLKLTEPVVVQREGAQPGWVVEAGCWGQYLGRVDLQVVPTQGNTPSRVTLDRYQLIQIDSRLPEDPLVSTEVTRAENALEKQYGAPIFHDKLARSELEIPNQGFESRIGDLVTDSYREFTKTEVALEQSNFIYGELHAGNITTADVFNANPAVFNPRSQKAWTLHTLTMPGSTMAWMLNILYGSRSLGQLAHLAFSGMSVTFNPLFALQNRDYDMNLSDTFQTNAPLFQKILIGGLPLDIFKSYTVSFSSGMLDFFRYLNSLVHQAISLDTLQDTGQESWRVLARYLHEHSPITSQRVSFSGRIQTKEAELEVDPSTLDFHANRRTSHGIQGQVCVRVMNRGGSPSSSTDAVLRLLSNHNGMDYSRAPRYQEVASPIRIPALQAGESRVLSFAAEVPERDGHYGVTARIDYSDDSAEIIRTGSEVSRWFKASLATKAASPEAASRK